MKQISTRFSIAVHTLTLIAVNPTACTGDFIAGSVNTNPVVIRRIMGMLKKASLIKVRPGVGGATLLKEPNEISLLDVYRAVIASDETSLFRVHESSSIKCIVGRNIEKTLQAELIDAQHAMEQRLSETTLDQLIENFE